MRTCVALDDFSEEIMTPELWSYLHKLKEEYPKLKITMFTIPEQCSKEWLDNIRTKYDWIELAVHGTDHKFIKSQIPDGLLKGFTNWYKAPRWELSKEEFDKLHAMGYNVATNKTNDFKGDYVYDDGKELIKDIFYRLDSCLFTWHGHVQSQSKANRINPNGLPDVFDKFLKEVPKNTDFVFVSEHSIKLNIGCGNYPILKRGWINLDKKGTPQKWEFGKYKDIIKEFDLLSFPYPFKNSSVDCITISHVLNQVTNHKKIYKELHRILIDGGVLRITDDDNDNIKSKYYKPHKHTVTKMIPKEIIIQLLNLDFSATYISSDRTHFYDKDIMVDNHPDSVEGKDKFFIEARKWGK